MFIISELGTIVKIIVSTIVYLLFLPVNLLDKLVFGRIFEVELTSEPMFILITLFMFFLVLGILLKIFFTSLSVIFFSFSFLYCFIFCSWYYLYLYIDFFY